MNRKTRRRAARVPLDVTVRPVVLPMNLHGRLKVAAQAMGMKLQALAARYVAAGLDADWRRAAGLPAEDEPRADAAATAPQQPPAAAGTITSEPRAGAGAGATPAPAAGTTQTQEG